MILVSGGESVCNAGKPRASGDDPAAVNSDSITAK